MSTEYTHFSKLAFDQLFARGSDGSEIVVFNSSGAFVIPSITANSILCPIINGGTATLSLQTNGVTRFQLNAGNYIETTIPNLLSAGSVTAPSLAVGSITLGLYRVAAKQLGIAVSSTNIATFTTAALLVAKAVTATGAVTGSNLSGTNTGDVTIGTANGLSIVGQALSMAAAASGTIGVITAGAQSIGGAKTFKSNAVFSGLIGAGGSVDASAQIKITNSQTADFQFGLYAVFAATSAATTTARGVIMDLSTAAAAFVCTSYMAYDGGISAGAGSTITRASVFNSSRGFTGGGTISNSAHVTDNNAYTGNFFIHSTSTNPSVLTGYLQLQNQADPGAITDGVRLGSVDLSAGNASLSLRTETAVVTETVVSDRTLSVQINGTTYKICLRS